MFLAIEQTSPPILQPVTLAEVKTFLGVYDNNYDANLLMLIDAMTEQAQQYIKSSILPQSWKMIFQVDKLRSDKLRLFYSPITSITHIDVLDSDGNATALDSSDYDILGKNILHLKNGLAVNSVTMEVFYQASIATVAEAVPKSIKLAILASIASIFNNKLDGIELADFSKRILKNYRALYL